MSNLQNVGGNKMDQQQMARNAVHFMNTTANIPQQRQTIFAPYYGGNVPAAAGVDHQKWIEKQQKDRNFQQQRERLREFSNPSMQTISTETRIKNMMDKLDQPSKNDQKRIQQTDSVKKPADWKDFNNVQHLFVKPIAFSRWKEVPEAYRIVEMTVTRNRTIDIQLLYPILLSSGLSKETLGYIWNLSNCATPGSLNADELYIMLSLVAIAQNGYIFSSVDILHQFSYPPIPRLDLRPQLGPIVPTHVPTPVSAAVAEDAEDEFADFQSATVDSKPYHSISNNVGSRLASYSTNVKQQEVASDRTGAKTSQPTHINTILDEEFTEFQQATVNKSKNLPVSTSTPVVDVDLMSSQEDKYSVFRQLDTLPQIHSNDQDEADEEFGDFLSTAKTEIPNNILHMDLLTISETNSMKSPQSLPSLHSVASTVEGSSSEMLESSDATDEFGDFISCPVAGSTSVDSQSVSSLEMVIWDTLSVNGVKTSPRADSVPSLELKISDEDAEPDVQTKLQSLLLDRGTPLPADRYSLFSSDNSPQDAGAPHSDWNKCLERCFNLVSNAVVVFSNIMSQKVCEEVIQSEEGSEFVENIAEVYRVACRVSTSVMNFGLLQDDTTKLVEKLRKEWKNLTRYLQPCLADIHEVEDLRCSIRILDSDRIAVACGVCLLDVESESEQWTTYKLSYGGRQYHTTCANFWINCVDSLLPAVPFPRRG